MNINIEKFFALLDAASAVTVDDGAMLTSWETSELIGDPDNQVVFFSWTDGQHDCSDILTEGAIAEGVFDDDGKFVVENFEGEITVIRFFVVERLPKPATKDRAALAEEFIAQVARMQTDDEFEMTQEDAFATLNELIVSAREIEAKFEVQQG